MHALKRDYGRNYKLRREHAHVSVRYYLWTRDGPWRIPDKLHQGLITRQIAFPECAGTGQKILEVRAVPVKGRALRLHGRGNVYHFDEQGFVDLSPYVEAIDALKALQLRDKLNEKLIDLRPALRQQHFSRANLWKPTRLMLDRVRSDFQTGSGRINAPKIRQLTNQSSFVAFDTLVAAKRRSGR